MQKKYFIAIVLRDDLLARAEDIKQALYRNYGLKGALRSPAHITLHRPFEWKEEKESRLIETLEKFEFKSSFELQLNGFSCFEPRVIYVNVDKNEALYELQSRLAAHCRIHLGLLNEMEDMRGFHPHVTVAFRDLKKPLFFELWKKFKDEKFTGTMEVKGFSLLKLETL
ncbi:MAG: 2-5 ligase [Bacteroidetes bacterium]|nr:2-5 ligase [Bacteroidota bacterium]